MDQLTKPDFTTDESKELIYKRILICGLGSIGSFIAQSLSYFQDLEKLVLIDNDSVEESNLTRSVYSNKHIGRNKALVLRDILTNLTDTEIESYPIKYSESAFNTSDIDLIIDCRDIICNRSTDSIKVSISDRILIIDGRKVSYNKTIQGRYITDVNVIDLMNVSNIITRMIKSGFIRDLIKNNDIVQISLDSSDKDISKSLSKISQYNKTDIVYDSTQNSKISNIDEVVSKISNIPDSKDIQLELITKERNENFLLGKKKCNTICEIINFISNLIKYENYETYLAYIEDQKIVVTPEVGAA